MTRYPCPYCEWELQARPVAPVTGRERLMEALSHRLANVSRQLQDHIAETHPDEYEAAERLDIVG